jgi:hypothetical protein
MKMKMGENEILREYRTAKNPNDQIRILADLNCCSKSEMAQWLADHGEKVDGRMLKKTKEPEINNNLLMHVDENGITVKAMEHVQCTLTSDEALAVAELIDNNLIDVIRNDEYFDSIYALKNILRAYDKMCAASGYVGVTE